MNKFVIDRPFTDPDTAARKLVEIANGVEAVQDGRIHIEKINALFLAAARATTSAPGSSALLRSAGRLRHESGTYVKFIEAGAALFAWRGPDETTCAGCV
jgi:hypothetical protein